VYRIDPRTASVRSAATINGNVDRVAAGEGALWILDSRAGTVSSLEPGSDEPGAPIVVGDDTTAIAAGLGAVWVSGLDGVIRRIDLTSRAVTRIEIGAPLAAVAVDEEGGGVWAIVATRPTG
jgi:hypothetical protein